MTPDPPERPTRTSVIGREVGDAVDATAGRLGRVLDSALRRPGHRIRTANPGGREIGAPAGIESSPDRHVPPLTGAVVVRCTDYGPERVADFGVDDLDAFLAEPPPDWSAARWVNVVGLHPYVVDRLRSAFELHTLAAEDVLHVPQRPKLESYDGHLFAVADMLRLERGQLAPEQVSFFLLPNLLISFQERSGDVWAPIRNRLHDDSSRLRNHGSDYLLYALLDAIVDHFFPILEHYGDRLESLEEQVLDRPTPALLAEVHAVRHDLGVLRHAMWPTRQLIDALLRDESGRLSAVTCTYLRDVHQHAALIIDITERYREMGASLTDLYMSSLTQRTNETMKLLTLVATLFIPLTFLAGVYGMNFEYMPELGWQLAYPAFWIVCLTTLGGLLAYFRWRGWLGP